MITLDSPVIVEGKYDKIALGNILDALIIPTDGFRIFKDREKCALIRSLAEKYGVIVMTDSDSAGALIRSYLKNIVGDAPVTQVYIPKIAGKEKRKNRPSKEGLLGVEGMSVEVIEDSLWRCGVFSREKRNTAPVTKADLFAAGLSGTRLAAANRRDFLRFLDFPQTLTAPAMLDLINRVFSLEEFLHAAEEWKNAKKLP